MSDLIDKRTAIKIAESYGLNNGTTIGKHSGIADLIAEELSNLPTIEAEPVVHGEWEHLGGDEWCCTVCENVITTEGSWEKPTQKFCDECGAKMREDDGEKRRTNND